MKSPTSSTLMSRGLITISLVAALGASAFAQTEAERRRQEFEAAMAAVEQAEKARADREEQEVAAAAEAKIIAAQKQMRESVDAAATAAPEEFAAIDTKRAEAQAFAGEVAKKVEPELRAKFQQLPPVKPAPLPAGVPKGGVPLKKGDPAAGVEPAPAAPLKKKEETIIDADGQLIFDGSGKFGDAYQVVIFEENVRLKHPQFDMNSDKLVAVFKEQSAVAPAPGEVFDPAALAEEPEGGSQLERAVASGREVTVIKTMAGGEPQIAKARKATFYADREEVLLEIWPQVQRGNNLVMAKSRDTVIILKGEEMIVKGPVRTKIVGKGPIGDTPAKKDKTASVEPTVIDAERGAVFNRPSARSGHKEIFFDGNVSVADPGFDMVGGDNLTAYTRPNPKTGESEMSSAVMRGSKVEVKERKGEGRYGTARKMVTFTPSTSDIVLTGYPEIFDGVQHKKYDGANASIALNGKTKNVKGRKGSEGGRTKMTFTPGLKPPE